MTSTLTGIAALFQTFTSDSKASLNGSVVQIPSKSVAGRLAVDALPIGLQVPDGSQDSTSLSAPSDSSKFYLSDIVFA